MILLVEIPKQPKMQIKMLQETHQLEDIIVLDRDMAIVPEVKEEWPINLWDDKKMEKEGRMTFSLIFTRVRFWTTKDKFEH